MQQTPLRPLASHKMGESPLTRRLGLVTASRDKSGEACESAAEMAAVGPITARTATAAQLAGLAEDSDEEVEQIKDVELLSGLDGNTGISVRSSHPGAARRTPQAVAVSSGETAGANSPLHDPAEEEDFTKLWISKGRLGMLASLGVRDTGNEAGEAIRSAAGLLYRKKMAGMLGAAGVMYVAPRTLASAPSQWLGNGSGGSTAKGSPSLPSPSGASAPAHASVPKTGGGHGVSDEPVETFSSKRYASDTNFVPMEQVSVWRTILLKSPPTRTQAELHALDQSCLSRVKLFADVPPDLRQFLLKHASYVRLDAGQYLFRQNDPADSIYIVLSGFASSTLDLSIMHDYRIAPADLSHFGTVNEHGVVSAIGPLEAFGEKGLSHFFRQLIAEWEDEGVSDHDGTSTGTAASVSGAASSSGGQRAPAMQSPDSRAFFPDEGEDAVGLNEKSEVKPQLPPARPPTAVPFSALRSPNAAGAAVLSASTASVSGATGTRIDAATATAGGSGMAGHAVAYRRLMTLLKCTVKKSDISSEGLLDGHPLSPTSPKSGFKSSPNAVDAESRPSTLTSFLHAPVSPRAVHSQRVLDSMLLPADGSPGLQLSVGHRFATVSAPNDTEVHLLRIPAVPYLLLLARARREVQDIATIVMRQTAIFAGWPDDTIERIALTAERRKYKPGEVIVQQGTPADGVYIILLGHCRVMRDITVTPEYRARVAQLSQSPTTGSLQPQAGGSSARLPGATSSSNNVALSAAVGESRSGAIVAPSSAVPPAGELAKDAKAVSPRPLLTATAQGSAGTLAPRTFSTTDDCAVEAPGHRDRRASATKLMNMDGNRACGAAGVSSDAIARDARELWQSSVRRRSLIDAALHAMGSSSTLIAKLSVSGVKTESAQSTSSMPPTASAYPQVPPVVPMAAPTVLPPSTILVDIMRLRKLDTFGFADTILGADVSGPVHTNLRVTGANAGPATSSEIGGSTLGEASGSSSVRPSRKRLPLQASQLPSAPPGTQGAGTTQQPNLRHSHAGASDTSSSISPSAHAPDNNIDAGHGSSSALVIPKNPRRRSSLNAFLDAFADAQRLGVHKGPAATGVDSGAGTTGKGGHSGVESDMQLDAHAHAVISAPHSYSQSLVAETRVEMVFIPRAPALLDFCLTNPRLTQQTWETAVRTVPTDPEVMEQVTDSLHWARFKTNVKENVLRGVALRHSEKQQAAHLPATSSAVAIHSFSRSHSLVPSSAASLGLNGGMGGDLHPSITQLKQQLVVPTSTSSSASLGGRGVSIAPSSSTAALLLQPFLGSKYQETFIPPSVLVQAQQDVNFERYASDLQDAAHRRQVEQVQRITSEKLMQELREQRKAKAAATVKAIQPQRRYFALVAEPADYALGRMRRFDTVERFGLQLSETARRRSSLAAAEVKLADTQEALRGGYGNPSASVSTLRTVPSEDLIRHLMAPSTRVRKLVMPATQEEPSSSDEDDATRVPRNSRQAARDVSAGRGGSAGIGSVSPRRPGTGDAMAPGQRSSLRGRQLDSFRVALSASLSHAGLFASPPHLLPSPPAQPSPYTTVASADDTGERGSLSETGARGRQRLHTPSVASMGVGVSVGSGTANSGTETCTATASRTGTGVQPVSPQVRRLSISAVVQGSDTAMLFSPLTMKPGVSNSPDLPGKDSLGALRKRVPALNLRGSAISGDGSGTGTGVMEGGVHEVFDEVASRILLPSLTARIAQLSKKLAVPAAEPTMRSRRPLRGHSTSPRPGQTRTARDVSPLATMRSSLGMTPENSEALAQYARIPLSALFRYGEAARNHSHHHLGRQGQGIEAIVGTTREQKRAADRAAAAATRTSPQNTAFHRQSVTTEINALSNALVGQTHKHAVDLQKLRDSIPDASSDEEDKSGYGDARGIRGVGHSGVLFQLPSPRGVSNVQMEHFTIPKHMSVSTHKAIQIGQGHSLAPLMAAHHSLPLFPLALHVEDEVSRKLLGKPAASEGYPGRGRGRHGRSYVRHRG